MYSLNTSPSPTVAIQQATLTGGCDYQTITLNFTATPSDIQQITASAGLTHDPTYNPPQIKTTPNSIPLTSCDVYLGPSYNNRFSTYDEALLVYHPPTSQAWFTYEGID